MRLPFLSCANSCDENRDAILRPRNPIPVPAPKGGGGHGATHGGASGSKGSTKGSSSGSKGSTGSGSKTGSSGSKGSDPFSSAPVGSRGSTVPVSGTTFGTGFKTSTPYGSGGVKVTTIPQGQPFAGRTYGGATRTDIYGTSVYGSGYPGFFGSGVTGRNFPYIYPPIIWVDYGYGPHYLHSAHEYGDPKNTNRTGGPEMQAAFISSSSNTTFHIIADNSTVASLIGSIQSSCSGKFASNSSTSPSPYGSATLGSDPRPEGAIQYYRASSVVLTLDGYNNTAALSSDANANSNTKAVPLPSWVDTQLLNCLNSTIGAAVPLFDSVNQDATVEHSSSAGTFSRPELVGTVSLVIVVLWHLFS
ncbi:hypothetical protein GSI_07689 [Ganoderma sinense ZZ0214-1]|uniref:Uncharacterized protein n=1 Tax=Ganoderma sinense ZZ0214-1 TaxID=1077348 RepID=A0A2G8S8K5_9APHY|nr:hypothetical protein GSI_07689 [Ganoderma sinense ZZ0214-1]